MKTQKIIILLLISLFAFRPVFSQSFEGTLTYSVELEVSEKMQKFGMTKEVLIERMRNEGSWSDSILITYKDAKYFQQMGDNKVAWSVYLPDSNKLFSFQKDVDICTVLNTGIDLEEEMSGNSPEVILLDTSILVSGIKCEIVRVKWKAGYYDYYFNRGTNPINPEFYKNHKYDGWYEYLKIAKSLPIRIVKSTKGMMTVTMSLVDTKLQDVDDSLFVLPNLIYDENLNIISSGNKVFMRVVEE
jgi:hypothetical protein